MSINEAYMAPGSFDVSMRTDTPWLMSTIQRGGYLVVTPQYLGDPRGFTEASILDTATYTGIVLETRWRNGILTLEGSGLPWIFGDADGGIGTPSPTVSYVDEPIDGIITDLGGGGALPAAISEGTVDNTGTFAYTGDHDDTQTVAEVLRIVTAATDSHWRINPNGTIDAGSIYSNDIYQYDPEVVFVRRDWGSDALYQGLPVYEVESRESIRDWTSVRSAFSFAGINESAIVRYEPSDVEEEELELGGIVITHDLRSSFTTDAGVGDVVWVHDPGSGFTGDGPIWFRGQLLSPLALRIHETETPITTGMGIYYRPNLTTTFETVTTADWVDLTNYVSWEASPDTATTYLRTMDVDQSFDPCTSS